MIEGFDVQKHQRDLRPHTLQPQTYKITRRLLLTLMSVQHSGGGWLTDCCLTGLGFVLPRAKQYPVEWLKAIKKPCPIMATQSVLNATPAPVAKALLLDVSAMVSPTEAKLLDDVAWSWLRNACSVGFERRLAIHLCPVIEALLVSTCTSSSTVIRPWGTEHTLAKSLWRFCVECCCTAAYAEWLRRVRMRAHIGSGKLATRPRDSATVIFRR